MRGQVYTGNPLTLEKERNIQGIWAEYAPRTNLIWLLFILKNLMKHVEHKDYTTNNIPPNQPRQPLQSRPEKANKRQAPISTDDYSSTCLKASGILNSDETPHKHHHKNNNKNSNISQALMAFQTKLRGRLEQIVEILDLEHGRDDMCCAADLVAYAIDQRWLDESDFFLG